MCANVIEIVYSHIYYVFQMNKGEVEDSSLTACIQENTLLSLDGPSPLDINIIVYLNKTVGYFIYILISLKSLMVSSFSLCNQ